MSNTSTNKQHHRLAVRYQSRIAFLLVAACTFACNPVMAASNSDGGVLIVTDTPVTHSLVSMVTGDLGQVSVLMQGTSSPHNYSLRPSEAASLQSGDLLVWTSHTLTPWLANVLLNDNQDIESIELMAAPETLKLEFRNQAIFDDDHDHDHAESDEAPHSDESSHADHTSHADEAVHSDEAAHADESAHSDLAAHSDDDGHGIDPHGWLDPVNAIYWLDLIAEKLSIADPQHASDYQSNAQAAQQRIQQAQLEIGEQLAPAAGKPFVVFHDSYHYFEDRFKVYAKATVSLGDAEAPGIKRMTALRDELQASNINCLFTEPQFSDSLIKSLTRNLDVSIGTLDPIGAGIPLGPDLYLQVLGNVASELGNCLSTENPE